MERGNAKRIEEALNSIEGIQPGMPPKNFFEGVSGKINAGRLSPGAEIIPMINVYRIAAGILLIAVLNVYTCVKFSNNGSGNNQTDLKAFASEYFEQDNNYTY